MRLYCVSVADANSMTCKMLSGMMTAFAPQCRLAAHPLKLVHGSEQRKAGGGGGEGNTSNSGGLNAGVPRCRRHAGPLTAVCLHAPPSIKC